MQIKKLSRDQIETMMDYARSKNSPKVISFLLDYIKTHYNTIEEDYEL